MYNDTERLIFKHFNGTKEVCKDPMMLQRRLSELDIDFATEVKVYDLLDTRLSNGEELSFAEKQQRASAEANIIRVARYTFDLPEFDEDGHGVTDLETIRVLQGFMMFVADVKKKRDAFVTCSPPIQDASLEPIPLITKRSADCISTVCDVSISEVCTSPTASVQLSVGSKKKTSNISQKRKRKNASLSTN